MRRALKVATWVLPWIGVAAVVWRQQSLEAALSDWVAKANAAVSESIKAQNDALGDWAEQTNEHLRHGVVRAPS